MPITIKPLSALILAMALSAPAAFAQVGDDDIGGGGADPDFIGNTGAIVINGLSVTNYQDLYFGVIAPSLTEFGIVQVKRGSNNNSVCDVNLVCLQNGTRARYKVVGTPRLYVNISDPGSITVSDGSGNTMTVDTFTGAGSGNDTAWRGWQRLRSTGISRFNVGANLHVKPNQPPGHYTGTFVVSVDYQ